MNEQELVAGLRSGDSTAFEQLVRTYSRRLLATAARMLGSERDAEDVVQDSLISAWKGIAGFDGAASLYTWLHRISVNACLARLRTMAAKSEVPLAGLDRSVGLAFEGLPTAWAEPGPNLEKRLAMRHAIQRALQQIPEEFRTVLLLRDVEELSSREVSDCLGIPDATVRQRLHRARATMAELLRPELCDGPELTCGGQLDLLLDYIDNLLPAELQGPIHAHIESCPACTSLLHTYRMTVGFPRALADLTAPDPDKAWVSETAAMAKAELLPQRGKKRG